MMQAAGMIAYKFDNSDGWILRRAVESIIEGTTDSVYNLIGAWMPGRGQALREIHTEWSRWLDVLRVLPTDDEMARSGEIQLTPDMLDALKWRVAGELNEAGRMLAQITPDNLEEFDVQETHDVQGCAYELLRSLCAVDVELEGS